MPRKIPDSDSDSQKENQSVRTPMSKTKVKAERVAGSSAKLNRVASRVNSEDEQEELDDDDALAASSRKQHSDTIASGVGDEESEDAMDGGVGVDDDDEEGEHESPNGRKRARINEEGAAVSVKEEKVRPPRRVTLPRDKDGYVPGSIVRIQLENFVTYDFVEFRPGPNLNMILGPNGTGKSSIACAICIGLNGAPSLLGRSTELNAFVKHGHDKGYVEIELKGRIGTPNLVIRRNINSKNRSSQFTLSGNVVPGREINERIADLNVQVGNLCSFLPQDRVAEFAQMSPQQLLKETQRTAGDENLTLWHGILIEKGKELKSVQNALEDEKKRVTQLEDKQKSLERDVKRYRERHAIERQIELLELVLPYVEYRESKAIYDETKLARAEAAKDYKVLEEQNKPMKSLQEELNNKHDDLDKQRRSLKDRIKDHYKKTSLSIESKNKQAAARAEEALDKIKAIKRSEKDLAKNKARTKDEIAKLQEKVDNPPEHEPIESVAEEIKVVRVKAGDLKVEKVQVENRLRTLVQQSSEHDRTINEKQHELREQEDYVSRKLSALHKWDSDCAEVIKWLLDHKETNDFAKRVDIPAVVSATVRDKQYANAVEACFNANQLKTFITHSEEDYNKFNRLFIDTPEALGRRVRVTVWYRPQNRGHLLQPSLSPEELRELGFDGYAVDFVDCPEGVRWFLVKELNMHRTPIALDARNMDESRVQSTLSRLGADGRSPPNTSYIVGNTMCIVSRSAYGQRKTMTVTRSLGNAKNFVHPTIDPVVKQALDHQIAQARQQNDEVQARIKEAQGEEQAIMQQLDAAKTVCQGLQDRHSAIKKAIDRETANKAKLASLKQKLHDYENQPSAEEERLKYKSIVEKTVKERTKILAELVELIRKTIKDQSTLAVISLKQIQLAANVEAIDTLCNEHTAEAKRVKQTFDEASRQFDAAKKDSKEKMAAVTDKLKAVDIELHETFKALEEEEQQNDPDDRWSSEKVATALETERAKLDLNNATDSGVIEAYEARKREIESLQATVVSRENKCQRLQEKIQKTRGLWYPALTSLVTAVGEKFSAAFDRVRCAGEIRVAEHEDYEKWAIEIFVKFRDGESLTLLTGQRQSGGERSLTTILYLMSLTEHARAPFSLVDEVNQGMDQRYERAVHDQLVQVTCKTESGQYFLITPKLLPGLRYHESMKILCVNNGEWLPESKAKGVGNMGRMIDNFLESRPGPLAN